VFVGGRPLQNAYEQQRQDKFTAIITMLLKRWMKPMLYLCVANPEKKGRRRIDLSYYYKAAGILAESLAKEIA